PTLRGPILAETYARMLFVDFSSAFNTIIPEVLLGQSSLVHLRDACSPHCSSPSTPTTAPQETRLIKLLKFADDTSVICLIRDDDESAYRREVDQLVLWCGLNNLELNTLKTVEMTVDFRRSPPALPPLIIHNSTVLAVESFRFLGSTISRNLKWEPNINTIIKKAQQ